MLVLVFSWATTVTVAPKRSLLPVWSPCVCVLMIVVTGLFVTVLSLSRIAWPQPASLVSTSVTPLSVMKIATLPPLNVAALPGVELVTTETLSGDSLYCTVAWAV
jgi:hypothetical protein